MPASKQPGIIIRAGRVVCPVNGIDGPGTVVVRAGRIESVELASTSQDTTLSEPTGIDRVLDFPNGILLPGLIDLHAHPATADSVFGIHPDQHMLARGVTAVMSQGDAGADNIDQYVESTIRRSQTKVLLAINLSRIGESTTSGCLEELDDADVQACVNAVARHREHIRAIAVNTSHHACGDTDPREVLRRGLQAAEETALPILYGMRRPEDWPLDKQLARLRAGDIVTYCFRREPHCIVQHGRVIDCVKEARQRGVLFDIGHGMGSFSFDVAETAIADRFLPDTISTDLQRGHLETQPHHDLPLTMSKLLAAGMAEPDIFRAVTETPAQTLGINDESGAIAAGRQADLVVLESLPERRLHDVYTQTRRGAVWTPRLVICSGSVIEVEQM